LEIILCMVAIQRHIPGEHVQASCYASNAPFPIVSMRKLRWESLETGEIDQTLRRFACSKSKAIAPKAVTGLESEAEK
jgi:hypothetical protein